MTLCATAVWHKRHSAMRPGEDVGTRRERRRRKWRKWRKWRGGGGVGQSVLECIPPTSFLWRDITSSGSQLLYMSRAMRASLADSVIAGVTFISRWRLSGGSLPYTSL